MQKNISVVISTYNSPEWIKKVIWGYNTQTYRNFEMLIADDGSDERTKDFIENFQKKNIVPVRYIWQENPGFRKYKTLNKTIAPTNSDYIIQVDWDCILHKKSVEDYFKEAQKGLCLDGLRGNIFPEFVKKVLSEQIIDFDFFSKEIKKKTRCLHIPFLSKMYKSHMGIFKKNQRLQRFVL